MDILYYTLQNIYNLILNWNHVLNSDFSSKHFELKSWHDFNWKNNLCTQQYMY